VKRPSKPLAWLEGEIKSPPFSREARVEAGYMLRRLQEGENLGMPQSRPMPAIGPRCHELRITDASVKWRIVYRVDEDAIVIAEVFRKKTRTTPKNVLEICRDRLRRYDDA
jgi:phage-related protein